MEIYHSFTMYILFLVDILVDMRETTHYNELVLQHSVCSNYTI